MSDTLRALEGLLAEAFASGDPVRVLREARTAGRVDGTLAEALASVDEDGVELSGLLIAKLRFERIVQGSGSAREWFERDPQAFIAAFRRYQLAEPPREAFPGQEGRRFESWLAAENL